MATWTQQLAAQLGGAKPWLTIWVLMIMMGAAFVATGYVLLRTAANPVRAVLLWVANPLLIVELVMGGHLDAFVALFAIAAIVLSRRCTRLWHDVAASALLVGRRGRHQDQRRASSRSASRSRCCTTGPGRGCSGSA